MESPVPAPNADPQRERIAESIRQHGEDIAHGLGGFELRVGGDVGVVFGGREPQVRLGVYHSFGSSIITQVRRF